MTILSRSAICHNQVRPPARLHVSNRVRRLLFYNEPHLDARDMTKRRSHQSTITSSVLGRSGSMPRVSNYRLSPTYDVGDVPATCSLAGRLDGQPAYDHSTGDWRDAGSTTTSSSRGLFYLLSAQPRTCRYIGLTHGPPE